jgi:hypothetical protein
MYIYCTYNIIKPYKNLTAEEDHSTICMQTAGAKILITKVFKNIWGADTAN